MCTSSDVASQQMRKIQGVESKQTEEVKKLGEKKKTARKRRLKKEAEKQVKSGDKPKRPSSSDKCRYCGRQQHHVRRTECLAFGQACSKCQKKGHFASVCYASKKVHQLEDSPVSGSDESCLRVETVSLVQTKAKQWFTDIKFFKSAQENFTTTLACQLETGATCNVISLDDLSAITQLAQPPFNESSVKLKRFGGSTMKPIGKCSLQVRHTGTRLNQSSERTLNYGVPQGSVLGPVLFTLFFAPLEEVIAAHGLDCMLYADDTQLCVIQLFKSSCRAVKSRKLHQRHHGLVCCQWSHLEWQQN